MDTSQGPSTMSQGSELRSQTTCTYNDWTKIYGNVIEEIPKDAPEPLGNHIP